MIRVTLPPPPAKYLTHVRARGEAFLRLNPNPSPQDWKAHAYWREIHGSLYAGHRGICVYSASWTPRRSARGHLDHTSVDHFVPKSADPSRAYEWTNFRLCRSRLNHRKDRHRDVLDPCTIDDGWFGFDFTTFRIVPGPGLPAVVEAGVTSTIARLELNLDNDYVGERISVIRDYSLDRVPFAAVESKYPFLARQIRIQDFDLRFKGRFAAFFGGRAPPR